MAMRSSPASGICKKIVRKIGADVLPLEALISLKAADKSFTADQSQRFSSDRHVQFCKKPHHPKRTWKPNLQLKRIFTYIHDRDIQPKVTIHTVKCVDRTGGVDKYTVKTPYYKSETTMGLLWKGKTEGKYVEFWNKEVGYFSPREEAKISKALQNLKSVS